MARSSNATSGWKLTQADIGQGFTNNNGPWTIACWFKAGSNAQANVYIATIGDAGGGQLSLIYEFVDNTVELYGSPFSGTDPRTSSGIVVADTSWHHLAYRKAASGTAAYDKFLDGTKTSINASATSTVLLNASAPTTVTLFSAGPSSENNCALEQFGLWNAALTDQNIVDAAAGTLDLSTLTTNMVNFWPLCGSASPETDLGSANKPLTVSGPTQVAGPTITSTCSVGGGVIAPTFFYRSLIGRQT